MPKVDGYYTVREAAEELGISMRAVQQAIARDTLASIRASERLHLIAASEVQRYKTEHLGRRGRPRTDD